MGAVVAAAPGILVPEKRIWAVGFGAPRDVHRALADIDARRRALRAMTWSKYPDMLVQRPGGEFDVLSHDDVDGKYIITEIDGALAKRIEPYQHRIVSPAQSLDELRSRYAGLGRDELRALSEAPIFGVIRAKA